MLKPGANLTAEEIQDSIDAVLEEMDVMLVLWSEHSAASGGVAAEVMAAERLGLRTIPCFIDYDDEGNVVPPITGPLARYLGVDFHHFETGIASLASLLAELGNARHSAGHFDEAAAAAHPPWLYTRLRSDWPSQADTIIAANAPLAIQAIKRVVHKGLEQPITEATEYELEQYNSLIETKDRQEGINAFNEKRAPRFSGE